MQFKFRVSLSEILLLITLLFLAVLVNWPIISYNMMYIEQATIYNANQTIHSFADLIHVYTHPQMLDFLVPFFRPSGHFLMYQLLTPFIGWYNTKALLVVNLLFLGLIAYVMVKLYKALFPGFIIGGFIACGIYGMNPALMISKLTIMHFEFAYVFFVLLGLYSFVVFCKKNQAAASGSSAVKFQHNTWLLAALVCYFVAVTFKEPALMLGPVMAAYFLIFFYQRGQFAQFVKGRDVLVILSLLVVTSVVLALYLSMSWQRGLHPLLNLVTVKRIVDTAEQFAVYLFSLSHDHLTVTNAADPLVRLARVPLVVHYIMWGVLLVTGISLLNLFRRNTVVLQKSVLFLLLALFIFMLLPLLWGMGFGWHLSLSLVCEAMLLGFGVEFYARHFLDKSVVMVLGSCLAIVIGLMTYKVDKFNIDSMAGSRSDFIARLDYNAVFHAPAVKSLLNDATIVVVQDNMNIGDYYLGNSTYPMLTYAKRTNTNFDTLFLVDQRKIFWQVKPVYSGNLFHWAYAMPNLHEEVVSFSDGDLKLVPDAILLSWVRHVNNIVCLAFDGSANWFDNTATFKKNILAEQKHRRLLVKSYKVLPVTVLQSVAVEIKKLPYADPELCQTMCDNVGSCKGFTYTHVARSGKTLAECYFYNKMTAVKKGCGICTGYVKSA
jgi:hypothetical protein